MSSPCPRLVRCRMRDLASCFYACRLPIEEEPDNVCSKSPQVSSNGRKAFDSSDAGGARKKTSRKYGEEYSAVNLCRDVSRGGRVAGDINGSEPHFAEEEYIVFCFREDGEIDTINEVNKTSPAAMYQSVIGGGGHADVIANTTLRPMISSTMKKTTKKVDEKWSNSDQWPPNIDIKEKNYIEQPNNSSKMDSFETCDSNLSDTTSTSSFAFPELGLDWIGSPVHMPKPENHEAQRPIRGGLYLDRPTAASD